MAIALDATASGVNSGASAASYTATISHVLGGGSNRAVVVCVDGKGASGSTTLTISTCTYNGVAMTQACTTVDALTRVRSAIYYLLDASLPAAGTYNVVVTCSDASNIAQGVSGEVYSLTGVKQSAQPDNTATYNDDTGGTSISKTITPVADNTWIFDSLAAATGTTGATAAGSQANAIVKTMTNAVGCASTLGPIHPAASTATGWGSFVGTTPNKFAYCRASFAPAPISTGGAITGSGAVAGAGVRKAIASGAATGSGAVSGVGLRKAIASASASGSGAVSGSGVRTSPGAGTISGTGALSATGVRKTSTGAAVAGTGALSGAGVRTTATGATASGSGALAGAGVRTTSTGASASGSGALAATGVRTSPSAGVISGTGALSATGVRSTATGGAIAGGGSLAGAGVRVRTTGGTLAGAGVLVGAGVRSAHGLATASGSGVLVGTGVVTPVGGAVGHLGPYGSNLTSPATRGELAGVPHGADLVSTVAGAGLATSERTSNLEVGP